MLSYLYLAAAVVSTVASIYAYYRLDSKIDAAFEAVWRLDDRVQANSNYVENRFFDLNSEIEEIITPVGK